MRVNKKMPLEVSVRLRYLHRDKGLKISSLVRRREFQGYSKSSIYYHAKLPINTIKPDQRAQNNGRPRRLTERDERNLVRALKTLRKTEGSFSASRLKLEAGVDRTISNSTVRRCLNRLGYRYLQARRKGLMTEKDVKQRLAFARKVKRMLPADFWTSGISFYLDGSSFAHKYNPCDQAKSRRSMVWRKRSEGLGLQCTSKGKKEGTGGRMAHFVVCIAYNKGVMLCEQYTKRFTGEYFASFIRKHFEEAFSNSANPRGKLFLQDGDPRQNSKAAKEAIDDVGARLFSIPPRSPDINPIENVFSIVSRKLDRDAIDNAITTESFKEFSQRVKNTILATPIESIDRIIESMDKRMSLLIKGKGRRLKY